MEEKQLINLIQKLKSVGPDENWVILNRSRLAFRLEMEHKKDLLNKDFSVLGELFSFWNINQPSVAWRAARGFLAGFLILFGFGGATVWAAKQSLPGAPLYGIKIGLEKARMTVSFSQDEKLNLQAEMAENRLSELKEVMQASGSISQKKEKAAEVMENMEAQLSDASNRLSKNQSVKATKVIKTASKVDKTISQVKDVLSEEIKGDLKGQLMALAETADKAGIQALEMILKSPDEAQAEKEEILAKVDEKISHAENAIKEISEKANSAINSETNSAIAELQFGNANSAINSETNSAIAELTNIRAVLVKNQSDKAQELLNQAKTALIGVKTRIAKNEMQEALNDLSGVLETINLAKTMIKSAQTIADEGAANSSQNTGAEVMEIEGENASSTRAK